MIEFAGENIDNVIEIVESIEHFTDVGILAGSPTVKIVSAVAKIVISLVNLGLNRVEVNKHLL